MATVLLVDEDLGFVFWLGHALDKAGHEAFPAKSIPDALKLIAELDLSVHVAIVSSSLPDAAEFIATLRLAQKDLKVILLVGDTTEPRRSYADVQCRRPAAAGKGTAAEWLQMIRGVLPYMSVSY